MSWNFPPKIPKAKYIKQITNRKIDEEIKSQEFTWKTSIMKKTTAAKEDERKIYNAKNCYNRFNIFLHTQNSNNTQSLNRSTISLTIKIVYLQRTDCCIM